MKLSRDTLLIYILVAINIAIVIGGLVLHVNFTQSMQRQRGAIAVLDSMKYNIDTVKSAAIRSEHASTLTAMKIDSIVTTMRRIDQIQKQEAFRRFRSVRAEIDSVQEVLPKRKK